MNSEEQNAALITLTESLIGLLTEAVSVLKTGTRSERGLVVASLGAAVNLYDVAAMAYLEEDKDAHDEWPEQFK